MTDAKPSNAQRAVAALRQMIFSGALPAGSDHLESELAERLKMSRTPVHEAALVLASQGLVQLRPRKGVRILSVSPEDMAEIYDVLTELESLAAERAAEAGHSADALAELMSATAAMDAAITAADLDAWAAADDRFHRELVRLGGNSRVVAIAEMMSDQVRRARQTTLHMRPLPTRSNADHRRVCEAIRDGDAATARACHRAHRQEAKTVLLALLRKHRLHYV